MDKNAVYTEKYNLMPLDVDKNGRIKISSLLEMFQDAAGKHTLKFNCDMFSMAAKNLYWVLVDAKTEMLSEITIMDEITVVTWPQKSNGVRYYRNFLVKKANGEIAVKAQTCWAVLSTETKTIVRGAKTYPDDLKYYDGEEIVFPKEKIADFAANSAEKTFKPLYFDLDRNGHVNNAKYADYALDAAFAADCPLIKTFKIEYRREIVFGEEITEYVERSFDKIKVKGVDENGEIRFICEITF